MTEITVARSAKIFANFTQKVPENTEKWDKKDPASTNRTKL